jgi:hypothetical protein
MPPSIPGAAFLRAGRSHYPLVSLLTPRSLDIAGFYTRVRPVLRESFFGGQRRVAPFRRIENREPKRTSEEKGSQPVLGIVKRELFLVNKSV